jgi:peptide-methionine (S)-S-oxide reductase
MPSPEEALPGRAERMPVPEKHFVLGTRLAPPFPEGTRLALFGLGCFWGAEKEVCTGRTGHNEVVRVVFDPAKVTYTELLRLFWEGHDPTQGMRQGNDVGTQYRSGIYAYDDEQRKAAEASRDAYQNALTSEGHGTITTEIIPAPEFYYAEEYHQQYLAKNPGGYCGHGGTGVSCPVGLAATK